MENLSLTCPIYMLASLPTSYQVSDVSFTLLGATLKRETGEEFNLSQDPISMGLMTEAGKVTNAGLLLCDQGILKQSRVVCTHWKGITKGSVEGDALDDEEFSGASLITLLNNAESFIRNNSKNPWTIRGMHREEKSDYPFKAVREVLVNALIHRDYQNIGSEIHVDMYDDRLDISSPGGMMNGSRIQDLDLKMIPSMRRNEIISDIFGRLHYMDRRGSGIRRVMNSYADFDIKPIFYSNEYFFLVSLPNRGNELRSGMKSNKTQLTPDKTQLTDLKIIIQTRAAKSFRKDTLKKIINLLEIYEFAYPFNRQIVATQFGISQNAASRILKKAMECGIIRKERRGIYYFREALVNKDSCYSQEK